MAQPTTTITMLTTNDDGWRDPTLCDLVVLHTFETDRATSAEAMAAYQLGDTPEHRTGSYTVVVAGDGRSARENDDDYIPWAAGPTANRRGLHLSFGARASDTREIWLAHPAQLAEAARIVREWCQLYNIRMDGTATPASLGGICDHAAVAAAWRETTHTDVGPGFPWDVFLDLVKQTPPPAAPAPTCLGSAS